MERNNERNNESPTKKYVIANIKIPIEIMEDGSIEPQKEYIDIEFSECEQLPKKQECDVNHTFVMNNLSMFLQTPTLCRGSGSHQNTKKDIEIEPIKEKEGYRMIILKEDIKPRTSAPKINTSFKQNTQYKHRHTIKHHSA